MTAPKRTLPSYKDLPDGTSYAVFGPGDQLGCLNLLTPDRVKAAADLVVTGEVVSLNAPLTWPDPPPFGEHGRGKPQHHIVTYTHQLDEYFDGFYPQSGSQWDGFLHQLDPETGKSFNDNDDQSVGIEVWAERGIVGRGVLLDIESWVRSKGRTLQWDARETFSVADLEGCAADQGVTVDEGTILLVRLGWESGYNAATPAEREAFAAAGASTLLPGLEGSVEIVERLWDWGVAAVATDAVALEAFPPDGRFIHVDLLTRLGIPIGEMWSLAKLAEACATAGRYEFLLASAPLNVPGWRRLDSECPCHPLRRPCAHLRMGTTADVSLGRCARHPPYPVAGTVSRGAYQTW